jgi:hypothetical protein
LRDIYASGHEVSKYLNYNYGKYRGKLSDKLFFGRVSSKGTLFELKEK